MHDFYHQLNQVLADSASNRTVTENGAVGYKTTGQKLVDLNFAVSSLRSVPDEEIVARFTEACGEDLNTAIVWLFFARDIRGGMGERRLFRVCMKYLAREFPDTVRKLLPLIAEYGRWDDLLDLAITKVGGDVKEMVKNQLARDMAGMHAGKSVSLLAKWMPSINTSSKKTKESAERFRNALGVPASDYRKMLSALRRYLNVTERKMSANRWEDIQYEAVPSKANLIYNNAFLRHDEERRREYLGKVEKGEAKINSSVLFPHDIVHNYMACNGWWSMRVKTYDSALEGMWKNLPNTIKDGEGTIVVADGSGSMTQRIGNTQVTAWEVAHALAIYFAERLPQPFKDRYITFSRSPQLVRLGGASSLCAKLEIAIRHDECANTNIEAVFNLILETAQRNGLSQREMPRNILIISDMEFDGATCERGGMSQTLFEKISATYRRAGYLMPRLIFWNVNSRTGAIPVKQNKLGVALVSGFSPNVAKMVMSNKLDPFDVLLETLHDKRYQPVWDALLN